MPNYLAVFAFVIVFKSLHCEYYGLEECTKQEDDETVLKCENYIPLYIHETIKSVEIVFTNIPANVNISKSRFAGNGWSNVTTLLISGSVLSRGFFFETDCFVGLTELRELYIHVTPNLFLNGSFNGLNTLKTLDISNSIAVKQHELISVILAEDSLPALEKLIMVRCGSANELHLDEEFWRLIEMHPISYIDLSNTLVQTFNLSAVFQYCRNIRTLILHGINVADYTGNVYQYNKECNIDVLDWSNTYIYGLLLCYADSWSNENSLVLDLDVYKAISVVRDLSLDSVCPASGGKNYFSKFRNVTFKPHPLWQLRKLSYKNNKLAHFDVQLVCHNPYIETISVSGNGMEYLNPESLPCVNALKNFDLSDNRLGLMSERNSTHFESLLKSLKELEHINLSRNGIVKFPKNFFANNSELQTIDLSGNLLEQIEFNMAHLKKLSTLDLQNNLIEVINAKSCNTLDLLIKHSKVKVDLRGNPLQCAKCEHVDSIRWLVNNRNFIQHWESMKCSNKNHKLDNINKNAIKRLYEFCQLPGKVAMLVATVSSGLLVLLTFTTVLITSLIQKWKRMRRSEKITKIINQESGHEYIAFLSNSSADSEPVMRYILPNLETNLKDLVGVKRDLVCLGDKHFRAGRPIYDETVRCLTISAVVILVVSDEFCTSDFCRSEFLLAYEMKKPIVLMIRDACSENLMPSLLREMFMKYTRIIWHIKDDSFEIKTTWKNVCNSVIDLAISTEGRQ